MGRGAVTPAFTRFVHRDVLLGRHAGGRNPRGLLWNGKAAICPTALTRLCNTTTYRAYAVRCGHVLRGSPRRSGFVRAGGRPAHNRRPRHNFTGGRRRARRSRPTGFVLLRHGWSVVGRGLFGKPAAAGKPVEDGADAGRQVCQRRINPWLQQLRKRRQPRWLPYNSEGIGASQKRRYNRGG